MRTRWISKAVFFLLPLLTVVLFPPAAFSTDDSSVPRITVQEVKAKLDKGEDVVILDMRTGSDYSRSKYKIKGAIRMPVNYLESRYKELPRDKEIVTYCT